MTTSLTLSEMELPANWKVAALSKVALVKMGQSPSSEYYNYTRIGLPFFQGKAEFGDLYPSVRKWCSQPVKIAPANSILLSVRAPVGPTNITSEPCAIGRGLASITPLPGIDLRYLLYGIRRFVENLVEQGTGTTFAAVNGKQVSEFTIPIAPASEQIRIADRIDELFTQLSVGVAALQRVKRKLVRYRAAVLHAAVTGRLTEDWRKNNGPAEEPGSKLLERILDERRRQWEQRTLQQYERKGKNPPKNWRARYSEPHAPSIQKGVTEFVDLPEGWCCARVEQLTHIIQYGTSAKTNDDASGIPVLRMGNITTKGTIDYTKLKYLPKTHNEFPELFLEPGDILFNRTNSADLVGKTAVFEPSAETTMSFASYLIRMRTIHGCSPSWLTWCIISPLGQQWLSKVLNHTAGQANVNGTKLSNYIIPLPPIKEQQVIIDLANEKLTQIDVLEANLEGILSRAFCLRQSILKLAFEGKLA